jgi:hypothetical protein
MAVLQADPQNFVIEPGKTVYYSLKVVLRGGFNHIVDRQTSVPDPGLALNLDPMSGSPGLSASLVVTITYPNPFNPGLSREITITGSCSGITQTIRWGYWSVEPGVSSLSTDIWGSGSRKLLEWANHAR